MNVSRGSWTHRQFRYLLFLVWTGNVMSVTLTMNQKQHIRMKCHKIIPEEWILRRAKSPVSLKKVHPTFETWETKRLQYIFLAIAYNSTSHFLSFFAQMPRKKTRPAILPQATSRGRIRHMRVVNTRAAEWQNGILDYFGVADMILIICSCTIPYVHYLEQRRLWLNHVWVEFVSQSLFPVSVTCSRPPIGKWRTIELTPDSNENFGECWHSKVKV
jgi:hypothetical protein